MSLNSFRINKTLKLRLLFLKSSSCLNSFRINKTSNRSESRQGVRLVWIPSVLTRLSNCQIYFSIFSTVWIPSVLTRLSNGWYNIFLTLSVWIPSVLTRLSNLSLFAYTCQGVWIPSVLTRLSNRLACISTHRRVWIPSVLTRLSNFNRICVTLLYCLNSFRINKTSNLKSGSRRVVIFLR